MTLIYKDREPKLMNKADSASTIIIIICTVGFLGPDQTTVEYKVEKLKYKKDGDPAAEDQNQIQISPHEVLQS